jgi:hypothetical protein
MTQRNHIDTVRDHLLETLSALRDRQQPMDVDRARAIAEVATVLVNSAKVEVAYLSATNQTSTPFLEVPPDRQFIPSPPEGEDAPVNGITSITQHRLRG